MAVQLCTVHRQEFNLHYLIIQLRRCGVVLSSSGGVWLEVIQCVMLFPFTSNWVRAYKFVRGTIKKCLKYLAINGILFRGWEEVAPH